MEESAPRPIETYHGRQYECPVCETIYGNYNAAADCVGQHDGYKLAPMFRFGTDSESGDINTDN